MDWHEQLPILPALRTLTISKCGLASVHSSPLVLPSLEHLDLSGNNIETIPESTLHQLLHLKVIVLNDNKLKTWPTLPKIHFLHVHMSNNLLNDIVNLGASVGRARARAVRRAAGAARLPGGRGDAGRGRHVRGLAAAPVAGAAVALVAAALLVAVAVTRFRPQLSYLARAAAVRSTLRHAARHGRRFAFDVFLCYSEHERDFAMRHLVKVLESAPDCYRVCLYERDFKAAATLSGDVLEAVSASRKVLIVLTRRFVDTQYKEVDMDREFVVLLELEPLDRERAPRRLRFLLDTRPLVQWPASSAAAAVAASPRATGDGAGAACAPALGPSLHQRHAPPTASAWTA
ncbi:Toll-like receptor Tollo, partial [Gryllus bimaculatus]